MVYPLLIINTILRVTRTSRQGLCKAVQPLMNSAHTYSTPNHINAPRTQVLDDSQGWRTYNMIFEFPLFTVAPFIGPAAYLIQVPALFEIRTICRSRKRAKCLSQSMQVPTTSVLALTRCCSEPEYLHTRVKVLYATSCPVT